MTVWSPDRRFYWDGLEWRPAVSPDGEWLWNGAVWERIRPALAPYRSPLMLQVCVLVLLGLNIAAALVQTFVLDYYFWLTWSWGERELVYNISVIGLLIFAVTAGVFLIWFERVYRNLSALGVGDLDPTPAWAVGWWFVPVACFWKPYRTATELLMRSEVASRRRLGDSMLVDAWWSAWVISLILANVAAVLADPDALFDLWFLASGATTVLAAILAMIFVTLVSGKQHDRWHELSAAAEAAKI